MDTRLRVPRTRGFISKTKLFSERSTTSTTMSNVGIFSSNHKTKHEAQQLYSTPTVSESQNGHLPTSRRDVLLSCRNSTQQTTISISAISRHYVITILYIALISTQVICQQNLCPKSCTCDEQNLETICKENGGFKASGIPHTLNPSVRRMIINNAQISQFMGLDSWLQLETLDLAFNKISMIDFKEISKNGKLAYLNTSHNSIIELKDSALTEKGISIAAFLGADNFEPRMAKIYVLELIMSHNNLTTLRNLTFLRWNKLHKLDLSYNGISWLDTHSLVGLNKLDLINLRGNRLTQIPTMALQNTVLSVTNRAHSGFSNLASSIKILDLSENELTSIGSDSFSMLGNLQELYLESCSLQFIHEGAFNGLIALQTLSIDKNNLLEIPSQSFISLTSLKKISLNANNFTQLKSNSFYGLSNLEELHLNNGSFKEVSSRVFGKLGRLKRLELGFNPNLTKIEKGAFDYLVRLRYLSLNSNALTTLTDGFRDRPMTLDLRGNPFICGCDLKWLTKWLMQFNETIRTYQQSYAKPQVSDSRNFAPSEDYTNLHSPQPEDLISLKCAGPPALMDKLVVDLVENKLECLEPTSELNVTIGYVAMASIMTIIIFICLLSVCGNKKHLFVKLKENLVQNHISMMLPYSQNLHKNVDDLKKETELYGSDYEPIGCGQNPIYTLAPDQAIYYEPNSYSQYI